MHCPTCHSQETKVVDSRLTHDGMAIRRRRECEKCSYRFSTVEEMELLDIVVVKNDGRRESYSRKKLESGILHSLTKRPFTQEKFDQLIHMIERDIQRKRKREVTSTEIGEMVMKHLRKFDTVAYIRFASIYRAFEDVSKFQKEVISLQKEKAHKKNRQMK
jgi:transcriptional repressor NrdR